VTEETKSGDENESRACRNPDADTQVATGALTRQTHTPYFLIPVTSTGISSPSSMRRTLVSFF